MLLNYTVAERVFEILQMHISRNKGRFQSPSFVRDVHPSERSQSLTVTEIDPPEDGAVEDGLFARVVHDVFTDEECQELISSFNHKGFTPALVNTGGGVQT